MTPETGVSGKTSPPSEDSPACPDDDTRVPPSGILLPLSGSLLELPRGVRGARRRARNRFAGHLNPIHARAAAGSMSGSSHQVGKTNLLDPAQIRIVNPLRFAPFDDLLDVQRAPAHVHELNFRLHPVRRKA